VHREITGDLATINVSWLAPKALQSAASRCLGKGIDLIRQATKFMFVLAEHTIGARAALLDCCKSQCCSTPEHKLRCGIMFQASNRHRFALRGVRFLPRTRANGFRHCRTSRIVIG